MAALIALAASVGVLSPVGMAHAADGSDTVNGALQAFPDYQLNVTASTSRMALTDGKAGEVYGGVRWLKPQVEGRNQDLFETSSYNLRGPRATVRYRISMLGERTPVWVKLLLTGISNRDNECDFYDGDPLKGGKRLAVSPFNCRIDLLGGPRDRLKVHVFFDINRWAEASGKITTQEVSLTRGTFRSDLPYQVAGVTEMAPFQYTSFEAVNREGNKSFFENQARTEFSYEIKVGDRPTGVWVAGMSTNHRGAWFDGDGRCAIYDHDPLLGGGRLDKATPIVSKDYFCKAEGHYADDGRIHWHTDFTVGRLWP